MTSAAGGRAGAEDSSAGRQESPRGFFPYALRRFESVVAHDGTAPILFQRLVDRAMGSAANFIDASIVPVGAAIGIHTHTFDNEEVYIVLSGRGQMHVDGHEIDVTTGDVIVNRPGGTHGLTNTGDEDLRLIVIEVPVHEGPGAPAQNSAAVRDLEVGWKSQVVAVLTENPWFSVLQQEVTRPDGHSMPYYTIHFPSPAVGVVARRGDEFLLIRQYRFIVNEWVWAIPSGGIAAGETAEQAAKRELLEETGYSADSLTPLLHYYPSYGSGDQQFRLFLADHVTHRGDFDRSEVHDVRWFSRPELLEMIRQNGIVDGLSLTPLLLVLLNDEAKCGAELRPATSTGSG